MSHKNKPSLFQRAKNFITAPITLMGIGAIVMPLALIGITITVILYAKGYRLQRKGELIQTGALTLESPVRNTEFTVLGKNQTIRGKIPKNIMGIKSGSYKVQLTKDNYYSYTRNIDIRPGLSYIVFGQMYLQPPKIEFNNLYTGNIQIISESPYNSEILLIERFQVSENTKNSEVVLHECSIVSNLWKTPSCSKLWDSSDINFVNQNNNQLEINTKLFDIKPSTNNSLLLVKTQVTEKSSEDIDNIDLESPQDSSSEEVNSRSTPEEVYMLIDRNAEVNNYQLLENLPSDAKDLRWSSNENYLVYEKNNDLLSYDLETQVSTILLSDITKKNQIHLVNTSFITLQNNKIIQKGLDGQLIKEILDPEVTYIEYVDDQNLNPAIPDTAEDNVIDLENQFPASRTFKPEDFINFYVDNSGQYLLAYLENEVILLNNEDQEYYIVKDKLSDNNLDFVSFSPDLDKILFKKDKELYIYWFNLDKWDYLSERKLKNIYTCSTDCKAYWGNNSQTLFIWEKNENSTYGDLYYTDLYGENSNILLEDINSTILIRKESKNIFVKQNSKENQLPEFSLKIIK
jgi:hypothetical protein